MDENNKTVDINEFKREAKIRKLKAKVEEIKNKAVDFVTDHPTEALALATTLIGSAVGLARRADRKKDIREQQRLREEYIYDRSLGSYWKTRRKLSNSEKLEIERRRRQGESLGEILRSMRLL